jgi:MFS family permease
MKSTFILRTFTNNWPKVILALCLGSFSYGYNFSIISTTLGQPNFYAYFNLTQNPKDAKRYAFTNQITGAMNGLFSAGAMFGALFMGWLCDARGRRVALFTSALIGIVGGALQGGSAHIAMMLVARFVTGYSAGQFHQALSHISRITMELLTGSKGMLATLVPVFQSEIAPPVSNPHDEYILLDIESSDFINFLEMSDC